MLSAFSASSLWLCRNCSSSSTARRSARVSRSTRARYSSTGGPGGVPVSRDTFPVSWDMSRSRSWCPATGVPLSRDRRTVERYSSRSAGVTWYSQELPCCTREALSLPALTALHRVFLDVFSWSAAAERVRCSMSRDFVPVSRDTASRGTRHCFHVDGDFRLKCQLLPGGAVLVRSRFTQGFCLFC